MAGWQPTGRGQMRQQKFAPGSLVLYKIRPALITEVGEKITIQLEGDKAKRVRPKDIRLLHPGPLARLDARRPGNCSMVVKPSSTNWRC